MMLESLAILILFYALMSITPSVLRMDKLVLLYSSLLFRHATKDTHACFST
jgi:hypothetical protein